MKTDSAPKTLAMITIVCLNQFAHAHLALLRMNGETNGKVGIGMGVESTTPREGSQPVPFQLDSAIFRQAELNAGTGPACGRTVAGGSLDIPSQLVAAEARGLPDVGRSGLIRMVGHQVNSDGGGAYSCAVDPTASGKSFTRSEMIVNVPGRAGQSNAQATNFPIVTQVPPGMNCTGGRDKHTCIVRCVNGAKNGPFGGCMTFTQSPSLSVNSSSISGTSNQRAQDTIQLTTSKPKKSGMSRRSSLVRKGESFEPTEMAEEISSATIGARQ